MCLHIDTELQHLVPPLSDEEKAGLERSLKEEGCRDAIVVWGDTIVDGHNRYEICTRLEMPFETAAIELVDKDAAKMWMIDNQKGRRNLTDGWKFELAQVRKALLAEKGRENLHKPTGGHRKTTLSESGDVKHDTRAEVAKELGWSTGKVAQADKVRRESPEVWKNVKTGEMSVDKGYREMKKRAVQKRKQERKEQYEDLEMPDNRFRVIYADPPWKYNDRCENGGVQSKGVELRHYDTMTINEICNMQLPEIEDDAVLFLWTTSPLLEDSFRVVKAWGFKYKTSFVWDKIKHNMGHYNSVRHELLLVCTKGSCTPDNTKLFDSVQSIEKTAEHSRKPEEFRDIIDTLYTWGNKLELFRRGDAPEGWEVWGNEVQSAD